MTKITRNEVLAKVQNKESLAGLDLSGLDLLCANLCGAYLVEANLSGANLLKADLSGANLYKANLKWADLTGANLSWANLFETNIEGVKYDDHTIWPEGFEPPMEEPSGFLEPTVPEPTYEQIERWIFDSVCEATDGCMVETDGKCHHGHVSWPIYKGVI